MRELAPGIYSLGHAKGGHVHAFLLDNAGELTLVDTLFENDARIVLDAIHSLGRKASDLKRIALTHGHRSHLGGLAALKQASDATVYAHRWEADIVAGERRAQPVSILPQQSLKLIPFQLGLWLGIPKHVPWPQLCPGWHAFNLNKKQHHTTLRRLAALDATILGVGHGEPILQGAAETMHTLASQPVP